MRENWKRNAFSIITLFYVMGYIGLAQEPVLDLKKEIDELKRGQQSISKDIQEIKSILLPLRAQAQSAPPQMNVKGIEFDLGSHPLLGSDTAKMIIVEFTDYQCSYCARYIRETFPEIVKKYVDTGKIRYAVLDEPLPMHKMAAKAAEASHCANDQRKFWEIHDLMMSKQDALDNLSFYASSLKLDIDQFEDCLKTNKYAQEIGKEIALGSKLGVSGVPGFIIASIDSSNPIKVKGISLIRGAQPFANFQKEMDQAISDFISQKASK